MDAYAVPTDDNFPGIVALHPSSGRMFQCMVSKALQCLKEASFKVNLKAGIFETLEQLDSSISPAIYVVVSTPGNFDKWIYGMMVPHCLTQLQKR